MPVKGVRKMTAQAMVDSAFTAPHVTEFLTVDVTPMMELRARLKEHPAFRGVKITPLTFAAKAVCLAAKRTPDVNATWAGEEIVYKDYVHLGIAAATPRGLVVPKVRDADGMSLRELAAALEELTVTARDGKTPPADMLNGTFTITNVGVFGVDTGTPIINPGESAILALGAIRDTAVGRGRRDRGAQGLPAVAELRPPSGRRPAGLPVPGRRGRHPVRPRHGDHFLILWPQKG